MDRKRQKAESDGILSIKSVKEKQQWQQLTTTIQATAVGIFRLAPRSNQQKWLQLSTILKNQGIEAIFIH